MVVSPPLTCREPERASPSCSPRLPCSVLRLPAPFSTELQVAAGGAPALRTAGYCRLLTSTVLRATQSELANLVSCSRQQG